jgi:hypothetical protein
LCWPVRLSNQGLDSNYFPTTSLMLLKTLEEPYHSARGVRHGGLATCTCRWFVQAKLYRLITGLRQRYGAPVRVPSPSTKPPHLTELEGFRSSSQLGRVRTLDFLAAGTTTTSSTQQQLDFIASRADELRTSIPVSHPHIFIQGDSTRATWDESNAMEQANTAQSPSKIAQGQSILFQEQSRFQPLHASPTRPTALHRRNTLFTTGSVATPLNHYSKGSA